MRLPFDAIVGTHTHMHAHMQAYMHPQMYAHL